jgi:hypothetical protein
MNERRARERIRKAANLIETRGWTQHVMARDAAGKPTARFNDPLAASYCTLGAINAVGGGIEEVWLLERETGIRDIPNWNDDPERTKEDVVAVLRKVANRQTTFWGRLTAKLRKEKW